MIFAHHFCDFCHICRFRYVAGLKEMRRSAQLLDSNDVCASVFDLSI